MKERYQSYTPRYGGRNSSGAHDLSAHLGTDRRYGDYLKYSEPRERREDYTHTLGRGIETDPVYLNKYTSLTETQRDRRKIQERSTYEPSIKILTEMGDNVNYNTRHFFAQKTEDLLDPKKDHSSYHESPSPYTGRYGSASTTRSSTRHFRNILHPDYKDPENESLINKKSKLEIDLYKGALKDEKKDLSQAIDYNNELQLVIDKQLLQIKDLESKLGSKERRVENFDNTIKEFNVNNTNNEKIISDLKNLLKINEDEIRRKKEFVEKIQGESKTLRGKNDEYKEKIKDLDELLVQNK